MLKTILLITISILSFTSCKKDSDSKAKLNESRISLTTHSLTAFTAISNTKYLIVFETGLGDDHTVWTQKDIAGQISEKSDVLLYDRAGYGKSEKGSTPRNINKLTTELEVVINASGNGRKVILVAHSLGGMIVRDYAVKNPDKVAAILFVDPSHEAYNKPTQEIEDMIYDSFKHANGVDFGGTMEARELIEDSEYMAKISALPNIPVVVISSMKTDETHSEADRLLWYNAHELLNTGVSDFNHINTTVSGHYIMTEEPDLILNNLLAILNKLP